MIQDFALEDRDFIERMLGKKDIPADILNEYILLRRMGEVCFQRDQTLGFSECRAMLRRLGYTLPHHLAKVVNWRELPYGTKVIVAVPGKEEWIGFYNGTIDVGTIGIKPDMDSTNTKEFNRNHCRLWQGEVIGDDEHKEDTDWSQVEVDTPVIVKRTNGEDAEGLFKGRVGNRLQVQVGESLIGYAPRNVALPELAGA